MVGGLVAVMVSGCGPRLASDAETAGGDDADGEAAADVGDGTLDHELLVVAQTDAGPLYFVIFAQRLGDTFQGHARSAFYVDGSWVPGGFESPVDATETIVDNEVLFVVNALILPAGLHPFGPDDVTISVDVQATISEDDRLCGVLATDVPGDEAALFSARPLEEFDGDPAPEPDCDWGG